MRPRSATPEAPEAKPLEKAVGSVPLLSALMERNTWETEVRPLRLICSALITCTGDGVSMSICGISEPVTRIVFSFCCFGVLSALADAPDPEPELSWAWLPDALAAGVSWAKTAPAESVSARPINVDKVVRFKGCIELPLTCGTDWSRWPR